MKVQKLTENSSTRVKKAIFGDYTGKIKTFCTMTPENPQGKQLSPQENNKLQAQFKKYLKDLNIQYTKIGGSYGSKERSYVLYNISLNDAKYLSTKFDQQSFIFGKSSVENGVDAGFYMWDGSTYKLIDSVDSVLNASDFEDFYSRHGDFKYQFPFDLGESLNIVNESYLSTCCDDSYTMKARANARAKLYNKGRLY